jgi:hypothetical protein
MRCGKGLCPQHARPQQPEGFLCVTCARTGDSDTSDVDSDDDDDPYFYSSRYRESTGAAEGDPLDFKEGDCLPFAAEGEQEGFEDDMGGS